MSAAAAAAQQHQADVVALVTASRDRSYVAQHTLEASAVRAYRPYPLLAGEEEEEEEETEAEAGGAPAAAAAAAGGGGEAAPAHKKPGGGGGGGGHDKPQPGAQRGVHEHGARLGPLAFAGLAYGSLGVVFGDLGTSPLYTYASLFQDELGAQRVPDEASIRGGLACLVWALVLSCTLKYQLFMMSANYQGQGGLFSLLNSLRWRGRLEGSPRLWRCLQLLAIAGVALMTADGMLTSSVSVTSAVEGIGLKVARFNGLADPANYRNTNALAAAILLLVFALQSAGSARIGFLYSPVMTTWLLFIGVVGAYNIAQHPSVISAWSPAQLWRFWHVGRYRGEAAWRALGGVVLCLTGSEALYADMGHFGRGPIAAAWFSLVFPCLVLQYTGQSAFLLRNLAALQPAPADGAACAAAWYGGGACSLPASDPGAASCCARFGVAQDLTGLSFWHALPNGGSYTAMLVIATLASIVGSQSVITGVFTIYSQAAALGLFPPVEVLHTGAHEGQVFCPAVNRFMCVMVLIIVGSFQHSSNLTAVFGACVGLAFLCDSTLRLVVAWRVQRWPVPLVLLVAAPLLFMDGALASANVYKYFTSGPVLLGNGDANGRDAWIAYIPLIIFVVTASTMMLWLWGRHATLLAGAIGTATLLAQGLELAAASPPPSPRNNNSSNSNINSNSPPPPGGPLGAVGEGADEGTDSPPPPPPPPPSPPPPPPHGAAGHVDVYEVTRVPRPLARSDRGASFSAAFVAAGAGADVGTAEDVRTHAALGAALASLAGAGRLGRPPAAGLFVTTPRSLLDTEALSEEVASAVAHEEHPLELAVVLSIEFTSGAAFMQGAGRRCSVRRISPAPGGGGGAGGGAGGDAAPLTGVFHISIRYGWAERPSSSDEINAMLLAIGLAACHPASRAPELRALAHMRCFCPRVKAGEEGAAGPGAVGGRARVCTCTAHGAGPCLPISFLVGRDALRPAPGALLPRRAAASLFNAIAANLDATAAFLKIPTSALAESCVPVALAAAAPGGGGAPGCLPGVRRRGCRLPPAEAV